MSALQERIRNVENAALIFTDMDAGAAHPSCVDEQHHGLQSSGGGTVKSIGV
jgi:hypothetical protein